MKRITSLLFTIVLVVGILSSMYFVQPVKATETIYIRADGSIDPPTANITTSNNITYTFTGNINEPIVIERNNIVVDGEGFVLKGSGNGNGINLTEISNVTIKQMQVRLFDYGIRLVGSSNCSICDTAIAETDSWGIWLERSSNTTLIGNHIADNKYIGVHLYQSSNSLLENNTFTNNRHNFGVEGNSLSHFIHDIDVSNKVDGKPIYYWTDRENLKIPSDAGYVCLVNSRNITVEEIESMKNVEGILLAYTNRTTITRNTLTSNFHAIKLVNSFNNSIFDNNATNNSVDVQLYRNCSYNNIMQNEFRSIVLHSSCNHNSIFENNITESNYAGIRLLYSSDNNITRNNIADQQVGIQLYESNSNDISRNKLVNQDVGIQLLWFSYNCYIASNNITESHNYGVCLEVSFNNTLSRNRVYSNIDCGICTQYSDNNTIEDNIVSDNLYGLRLENSLGNSIVRNNISNNNYGIWSEGSSNNSVHSNNFSNTHQAYASESSDYWDEGYPLGGNHWSDYTGIDANNDGVGDTPYAIDANNQDNYPLVDPWTSPDIAATYILTYTMVGSVVVQKNIFPISEPCSIYVDVTFQNLGNKVEGFNATVYANNTVVSTGIDLLFLGGESKTITFTLETADLVKGNYTIWVYISPIEGETDIVNNALVDWWIMRTIPGDVDGDSEVTILDVVKITSIYGAKLGDFAYNPNSDLDNDGVITILDVVKCTSHYGEKYP